MTGNEFKQLRKLWGLTQHQLASKAGVKRATIANMESGRQLVKGRPLVTISGLIMAESIKQWLDFPALITRSESSTHQQ